MIEFYFFPSPNGLKIAIMLEECGLEYEMKPVDIGRGEQFHPEYLAINPNNKIPAIVDRETGLSVFESGAILIYLAEKSGRFLTSEPALRMQTLSWLFWQVGNQGPLAGQLSHFVNYAPAGQDYGRKRYGGEYERNLAVLENRLADRPYILSEYSIADMISFPWVFVAKRLGKSLDEFPNVSAWRSRIKSRPAVIEAINLYKDMARRDDNAENNSILFNQNAGHILRK